MNRRVWIDARVWFRAIKWKVARQSAGNDLRWVSWLLASSSRLAATVYETEEWLAGRGDRTFRLSIFPASSPFPGKIFLSCNLGRSNDVQVLTRENLSRAFTWPCSRQISTSSFCLWKSLILRISRETIALGTVCSLMSSVKGRWIRFLGYICEWKFHVHTVDYERFCIV